MTFFSLSSLQERDTPSSLTVEEAEAEAEGEGEAGFSSSNSRRFCSTFTHTHTHTKKCTFGVYKEREGELPRGQRCSTQVQPINQQSPH